MDINSRIDLLKDRFNHVPGMTISSDEGFRIRVMFDNGEFGIDWIHEMVSCKTAIKWINRQLEPQYRINESIAAIE